MSGPVEECKHGLDDDTCSICLHGLAAVRLADPEVGLAFSAHYEGRCRVCSDSIEVGERIAALTDGNGYAHSRCCS